MSKQSIDLTKPLSEDDRVYLESRNMQRELDENAVNLMGGGTSEADANEQAPGNDEPYKDVKVADLKIEIEKRNTERDDAGQIKPADPGNRPELVAALVADDEAEKAKAAAAAQTAQ